jgi:hypothetical protein
MNSARQFTRAELVESYMVALAECRSRPAHQLVRWQKMLAKPPQVTAD